ncbi:hypothetical protein SESBI_16909 [Sesbania bispinosa]|nr:hypothetical protein SESBI_16909 [Sesbania bispinosa]
MRIKMKGMKSIAPDSDSSSLMESHSSNDKRPSHVSISSSTTRGKISQKHTLLARKGKKKCTPSTSKGSSSDGLFKDKQTEEKFRSKFKDRKVLLGRLINLNSLKDCNWDLYPYTDRQDFGSFLE